MGFQDLGVPVDAVESRTAAICTNAAGESRVVIAAKGFVLIVDPVTEDCRQLPFPDNYAEYPYDTFAAAGGMFYMGAGVMFYALDPFRAVYTEALEVGEPGELCGFSYAEDGSGHLYMASYPHCRLYRYRPVERDIVCLGSIDPDQKYPSHMAVDSRGWVYVGTGTTRRNIVAYNPASGSAASLLSSELRTIGIGIVRQGYEAPCGDRADGKPEAASLSAYAQLGDEWVRLEHGKAAEKLVEGQVPASLYTGASFGKFHRQLDGEWRVVSHSLSDRELTLRHHRTNERRVIRLAYASEGASLSPIVLGPDHRIYGTSNHPLHFYSYGSGIDEGLLNLGSKAIQDGDGGNLAAYAIQDSLLVGAAYPGGHLHVYDTAKPVQLEAADESGKSCGASRNPLRVPGFIDIHRPRCAVALKDGEHIAYGGFPGYGMVGGGLGIYHLPTGEHRLIRHTELIPDQSTVALAESSNGLLIGGTSIETPGGADPKGKTACLYAYDWERGRLLASWRLREDIREYSLIATDRNGRIHTMTSDSVYFVWNPENETVAQVEDLSAWGSIVRQGWLLDRDEDCLYGALSKALFKIPLGSLRPERIAVPPQAITAGIAKRGDRLFYASSTHLWSYTL